MTESPAPSAPAPDTDNPDPAIPAGPVLVPDPPEKPEDTEEAEVPPAAPAEDAPQASAVAATLPSPRQAGREYRKTATVWAVEIDHPFEVRTPEGIMQGRAGDYLCQGPAGECWPIKKEIFEATYEALS
ncbi:MAG TPA: hypothetical protein VJ140_07815 [Actinomycetota bacterium]|nr:hypothetical protein [Actinomycetota bacterium]